MKTISRPSLIFALRTLLAALLALYISYELDLARPTWAFVTTYIVSAPLRGAGRSKGLYRILGTVCGAIFIVLVLPNLVDAPELLVLTIALWIALCLYLSIIDGSPRAYAFMLAGYTTALIGFPSVGAPQTIFDTAISRTEEIGVAILCIEAMSYLPFNPKAGDALLARIDKCMLDTRQWALAVMSLDVDSVSISKRSQIIIDIANLDALRIQAHYDTKHIEDIEGWIVGLQRKLLDFFADLVTFDAQAKELASTNPQALSILAPMKEQFKTWITSGAIAVPAEIEAFFVKPMYTVLEKDLVSSGIAETFWRMIRRRSACLDLRQKIASGVKNTSPYTPIAHYIDYRQATLYGIAVALQLFAGSAFWIASAWPEGGIMVMFASVICCFFSSLEAPPGVMGAFLLMSIIGAVLGYFYDFIVFPHIDGFVLLACAIALTCIPIGILMANPALTGLMLPVILGINLASFQNRFDADITSFLNNFIPQTAGILLAGSVLTFVRVISLRSSTLRLLTENGQALAALAHCDRHTEIAITDRMAHRSALALIRAPGLREIKDRLIARILLDLQMGRALEQLKLILPQLSHDIQDKLLAIRTKISIHFDGRSGIMDFSCRAREDILTLSHDLSAKPPTLDYLRLLGLLKTLHRGLETESFS